jgi:Programmed cell death protein 2, C-terminal putative domain
MVLDRNVFSRRPMLSSELTCFALDCRDLRLGDHCRPKHVVGIQIRHYQQPTHIPPCEHCGAPPQFEFQLMPQLLHYLVNECSDEVARSTTTASGQNPSSAASQNEYTQTVSPHLVESRNAAVQRMRRQLLESTAASSTCRLNWGVVAVYTCPHSCSTRSDCLQRQCP